MKILLAYFSYTGNVRCVADLLRGELEPCHEVTIAEIVPRRPHPYWFWLAMSFIPGCRVPIRALIDDASGFDLVFLGIPKWTVSCPPVNRYLRMLKNARGKPVAAWICCGGFDQARFLRRFLSQLRRLGMRPVAARWINRRSIREGACRSDVAAFCSEALSAAGLDEQARNKQK